MAQDTRRIQRNAETEGAVRKRQAAFQEAPGEAEAGADALGDAFLQRAALAPEGLGAALSGASSALRGEVLGRLQRERGNAFVQRVVAGAQGRLVGLAQPGLLGAALQRKVQTLGGEWDTDTYTIAKNATGREIGLDIDLKFTPQDPVDAKQIGLTQTVKAMDDGKDDFVDEDKKKRAVPAGQAGEGTVIDQLSKYSNPLYATGARGASDTLADTPTHATWGQHGWHYKDEHGALKTQDAHLKDKPRRPSHKNNAQQVFEVTALAIEGAQKDTYYGSVQWGWKRDAGGTFTQLPLTIESTGVPTATFTAAAEAWNKGKSSTGESDVKLPIAGETTGTTMPAQMSYDELKARIKALDEAIAKLPDGPDKTNKQFERQALQKEKDSRIGDFPVPDPNADTKVA